MQLTPILSPTLSPTLKPIIIPQEYHEQRADIALCQLTEHSRNHIQQLIKNKCAYVNEVLIPNRSYRLSAGDICKLDLGSFQQAQLHTYNIDLPALHIIYEDDQISVINKPAGQVVHTAAGHIQNTLSQQLYEHYKGKLSTFSNRPGIIHRLDKDTSGLMIIAKTDLAHHYIQQQFEQRTITKIYLAQVDNAEILPEYCTFTSKIGPHHSRKQLMQSFNQKQSTIIHAQSKHHPEIIKYMQKKQAEILIQPRESTKMFDDKHSITNTEHHPVRITTSSPTTKALYKESLLECVKYDDMLICYPHTGRQHQIRVQLAANNTPIIGDVLYNKNKLDYENASLRLHAAGRLRLHAAGRLRLHAAGRLRLHAAGIGFIHPTTYQQITIYYPSTDWE